MAKTRLANEADVSRVVALVATQMSDRLGAISDFIHQSLLDDIPELDVDPRIVELLNASVEGNVDTILNALRHQIAVDRIVAPTAALEYARRMAHHGVPVAVLVRGYRLGQQRLNELVFGEVRETAMDPKIQVAVLEAITSTLDRCIDWITQQVVVVYEEERDRWLETHNSARALRVREVVSGKAIPDVDAASDAIRYPLRWHHVAVVMWYPDEGVGLEALARLQRFLRELGQATEVGSNPLFTAADQTVGWGWLPYRSEPQDGVDAIRQFALNCAKAPSLAIGHADAGVGGFRRSHRSAQAARRVAVEGESQGQTVVAATDPGLAPAAMIGTDLDMTRFWVADVLGELASDTENDERLRETLRVFLRHGSSHVQAADELNLHYNTVKNRVGRAVVRRGKSIENDRLDVEIALLVCQWYGRVVLIPAGS